MNDRVQFALITKQHVAATWPVLAPWVIQALGEVDAWADINQLREEAERGTTQVWAAQCKHSKEILMVCLTEGMNLNGKPVLVIRWLGGRHPDLWLENLALIERWAATQGFHKIEVWGRAGWNRVLRPQGYREVYRVLEKLVDRGTH
jgi:hypothetical protein